MNRFFKCNILFWFYFCQGLPFGFFLNYLPVELREKQWSASAISLWSVFLGLPWACKFFWAPFVDTVYSPRWGRRRSWILPLNVSLVLLLVGTAFTSPETHLYSLIILLFFINLATATQDIAVDGLSVSLLTPAERGIGNGVQVVGYKVGMLLASTWIIYLPKAYGWAYSQFVMAGCVLPMMFIALFFDEKKYMASLPEKEEDAEDSAWSSVKKLLRYPGMKMLLIFIGTYKVGESMAGSKYNLMLYDKGYEKEFVVFLMGTYGMIGSLLGSLFGGLLMRYISRFRALISFSLAQGLFILGMAQLAQMDNIPVSWTKIVLFGENFVGGMVTTALFTFMMDFASAQWGGTQYTLFATVEVSFKIVAWQFSAYLMEYLFGSTTAPNYVWMYLTSFLFLLFPLGLLFYLRHRPIYRQFIKDLD